MRSPDAKTESKFPDSALDPDDRLATRISLHYPTLVQVLTMAVAAPEPDYQSNLSTHKASNYNTHASFVYSDAFTSPILTLLNPQPGESVVDLGCGTGEVTRRLVQSVLARVVGIDSSGSMVRPPSCSVVAA